MAKRSKVQLDAGKWKEAGRFVERGLAHVESGSGVKTLQSHLSRSDNESVRCSFRSGHLGDGFSALGSQGRAATTGPLQTKRGEGAPDLR